MLPDEDEDLVPERSVTAGELFRALREALGLSQRQFAKQLGVDHTHILRIERDGSTPGAGLLASCEERFHLAPGYLSYCLENMPFELVLPVDDPRRELYWANEFPDYAFLDGPETIEYLNVDASIDEHGMCGPWQAAWATSLEGRPRKIMHLHLAGECDALLLGTEVSGSVGVSGHGTQVDPSAHGVFGAHEAIGLERPLDPGEVVQLTLKKSSSSRGQSVIFRPGPGQMIKRCQIKLALPRAWVEVTTHFRVLRLDRAYGNEPSSTTRREDAEELATGMLEPGAGCADTTVDIEVGFENICHGRMIGVSWKLWPFSS